MRLDEAGGSLRQSKLAAPINIHRKTLVMGGRRESREQIGMRAGVCRIVMFRKIASNHFPGVGQLLALGTWRYKRRGVGLGVICSVSTNSTTALLMFTAKN
jgi:hypothetical protein